MPPVRYEETAVYLSASARNSFKASYRMVFRPKSLKHVSPQSLRETNLHTSIGDEILPCRYHYAGSSAAGWVARKGPQTL